MNAIDLTQILNWTAGALTAGPHRALATRVVTDSRIATSGDCFVALVGERYDGHDFIHAACDNGAGIVVYAPSRFTPAPKVPGVSFVAVRDTLKAYQAIAGGYRRRFSIPVVGVTGSNGKTTTKDMTAAVLSRLGEVVATEKNYNNEIGLPGTLLRIESRHKAAVVEMGMRGAGEIAELASIAAPTVGIVTNVGPVHIEYFGSVDEVAKEKGELIGALPPGGTAILNSDDPRVRAMAARTAAGIVTYGIEGEADVSAKEITSLGLDGTEFTLVWPVGKARVRLAIPGRHHVYNALAASAAGFALGVGIEAAREALQAIGPARMRTEVVRLGSKIALIDDAYNSSPLSSKAALEVLAAIEGRRKVAVLGDMLELGAYAPRAHRELGRQAAGAGVAVLIAVGEHAELVAGAAKDARGDELATVVCRAAKEAAEAACELLRPGDAVLVKGSRGVALDRVVEAVKASFGVESDRMHEKERAR